MDLISELGTLTIGSRMKRLSDTMMREVEMIYAKSGLDFVPRWFPVFYVLSKRQPKAITDLADQVGLSHPAVIQIVKELEKSGWVLSEKSTEDARKRFVRISAKGEQALPQLQMIWFAAIETNQKVLDQLNIPMIAILNEFENYYKTNQYQKLFLETMEALSKQKVEIIDYKPEYLPDFVQLNKDWISKFFVMEANDYLQLEGAQQSIIEQGGKIYFAKYGESIIGTVALLKTGEDEYEMAKMAVDTKYQGLGAGRLLGEHLISEAKKMGAKYLFLESNQSLIPALTLYAKLGFVEVPVVNPHYSRANYKAEMYF